MRNPQSLLRQCLRSSQKGLETHRPSAARRYTDLLDCSSSSDCVLMTDPSLQLAVLCLAVLPPGKLRPTRTQQGSAAHRPAQGQGCPRGSEQLHPGAMDMARPPSCSARRVSVLLLNRNPL